jgi:hypothetical protein
LLFAEDMVKKQFVAKTQEVLSSLCIKCLPDIYTCGEQEPVPYPVFEKWIKESMHVKKVTEFMVLSQACGLHMMSPREAEAPNLNYENELPSEMTRDKLL